jgi:hypothetical protein
MAHFSHNGGELITIEMKNLKYLLVTLSAFAILSCGSNSDNESLSNPRQTDDVNARNPEADRISDSLNNQSMADTADTAKNNY